MPNGGKPLAGCSPSQPSQVGEGEESNPSAGDTGSNLDYSGGRKTHHFPPPYGLGSHSLTHRPTENPTGMTLFFLLCHSGLRPGIA